MKTKLTLLITLLITTITIAQKGINYKALIKDNLGNVMANQSITIEFSILEGPEINFSEEVYVEAHTLTTDSNGIAIANIGEGVPESGFEDGYGLIEWGSFFGSHYLKVQIDTGSGFTDMGTTEFKAVPFALFAEDSNYTGLEIINEGNGSGWRLIGRNPDNYGNIANNAVDLSYSPGNSTTRGATGNYATTLGYQTTASGQSSLASGVNTVASGTQSMALGAGTIASGHSSTAMGQGTRAESPNATAIGLYNIGGGDPLLASPTDPLFEVGNGNYVDGTNDIRTNALTVLRNGTITAPSFDISEITDPKALITKEFADANYSGGGTGTSPTGLEAIDEGNGIGWRLIDTDPSYYNNIGDRAVDLSYGGDSGYDAGLGAYGTGSVAMGQYTSAGNGSVAMGYQSTASGQYATAFGNVTTASGLFSTTAGYYTVASGLYATAFGNSTIADDQNATVLGVFNDNTLATNTLFQVGNGTNNDNRSNAFVVDNNGIITAPSFEISEITDAKALITKEFADANYSGGGGGTNPTGLEAIDEGNGIGWRLIGRDPTFFGDIGSSAIDFSNADNASEVYGATGSASFSIGFENEASGDYSVATGRSSVASGDYSVAIGQNPTASANYSFSFGRNTVASADNSFSFGQNTVASGQFSKALGVSTNAIGYSSTAMGQQTTASGMRSTAIGYGTEASGGSSVSMGSYTIADNNSSLVAGKFNLTDSSILFQIGNGLDDVHRSNALNVYDNGTITAPSFDISEITDPKSLVTKEYLDTNGASGLEAINEGNGIGWRLIGKNPNNYGNIGGNAIDLSVSNSSSVLLGATGDGALATGIGVEASGNYSFAQGGSTKASGLYAVALGFSTNATGPQSVAMGGFTSASGTFSVALGRNTIADDNNTTVVGVYNDNALSNSTLFQVGNGTTNTNRSNAFTVYQNGNIEMGDNTTASGSISTAMGNFTTASGGRSTAMGNGTIASGYASLASGTGAVASGDGSVSMGVNSTASGTHSIAMGTLTIADDAYSMVVGQYNDNTSSTSTLFQVGNGSGTSNRTNALTVFNNGFTSVGTHTEEPTTDFQVYHDNGGTENGFKLLNKGANKNWWRFYTLNSNGQLYLYSKTGGNTNAVGSFNNVSGAYTALSDRRVKDNFKELYFNWEGFMQLKPLTYYYKTDENKQSQIGFIAQDVESIYPELVNYNQEDDLYQLNYSGFGVVAIKAIQELQKVITSQQSRIDVLEAKLSEKDEAFNALSSRIESIETLLKSSNK